MSYHPEFVRLVEDALRRQDRTPSWLAQRLGVNQSTVSRWLNQGARPRNPETVVRVADALGMATQREALLAAAGFAYQETQPSTPTEIDSALRPIHYLPADQTPFIGRSAQLAQVAERLADRDCRLLTVVGPGGIGKTRLAIRVAQEEARRFADGVCFVDLTPVRAPSLLASTILHALNAPESGARDAAQRLCDYLRDREFLLLLDNFEHLVDGVDLLPRLIHVAPRLKLIVTSRERLNLVEEWLEPVEGLALPPGPEPGSPAPAALTAADLNAYDATRLFLACMRRVRSGYEASQEDAQAIESICRLLEGMPLAIELAAAWTRSLPPPSVLRETQRSLDFLRTSLRDVPARHRSVHAVFDHSWSMLTVRERSILRQFSVFRGGATQEALGEVTGATLTELAELVDKSWVRTDEAGRYAIHELVRQYCEEKLDAAVPAAPEAEAGSVYRRHYSYYASHFDQLLQTTNFDDHALGAILADFGNLLVALDNAIEGREVKTALGLCWSIFFVGDMMGWLRFSVQTMGSVIPALERRLLAPSLNEPERTEVAHVLAGVLHALIDQLRQIGELRQAAKHSRQFDELVKTMSPGRIKNFWQVFSLSHRAYLAQSYGAYLEAKQYRLALLDNFSDENFESLFYDNARGAAFWQAHSLANLGYLDWALGDYGSALEYLSQATELREAIGEQRSKGKHLQWLAQVLCTQGELSQAERISNQGLALSNLCGDRIGIALGHLQQGQLRYLDGHTREAQDHLHKSLAIGRHSGRLVIILPPLCELGSIALAQGRTDDAEQCFNEAIAAADQVDAKHHNALAQARIGLANVALARGAPAEAKDLLAQAMRTRGRTAVDTMRMLAGMAEACALEGNMERAVALLVLVSQHAFTDEDARSTAKVRLTILEQEVDAGAFAGWRRQGTNITLDNAIAWPTDYAASRRGDAINDAIDDNIK